MSRTGLETAASTTTEHHLQLLTVTVIPTVDYAWFMWSARTLATTKLLESLQRIATQTITWLFRTVVLPIAQAEAHITPLAKAITPNMD
jgi:hypothetical protein